MESKLFTHALIGLIMLSCKHLRRCHDCRLVAIVGSICHRKKRNDRFTGTYITLDQTLHDRLGTHIAFYIRKCLFLCIGKFIRQLLYQFICKIIFRKNKLVFFFNVLFLLILHA